MQQELKHIIDALLKSKVFPNRTTLEHEAIRALLVLRPELRVEAAIARYRQGEISFGRAAELCGLSQEALKELLAVRGIFREVEPLVPEVFEQAVEALRRAGA